MNEKRGAWYLLTGLILGLFVGIVLSRWVIPVQYSNTEPYSLRDSDRKIYRAVIAQAYMVEADTNRALARLALLRDANPSEVLIAQAQNLLGSQDNEQQARALALLAAAVNQPSLQITPLAPVPTFLTPTPEHLSTNTPTVETPTRTPAATNTPRPTNTPQATLGAPFVLEEQSIVCEPLPAMPLLQITILNAAGEPVPGMKIEISQPNGGVETFYTGLYPEISRGYADYEMQPGMVYAIRVGDAGQLISNLSIPACDNGSGGSLPGSLKLVFRQP
ncbi:MAG: hypothetical protein FD147_1480 [Chloroflexi bacterium]|nr:MAG: hypothetical protein FD147_1480 [Chloroflexota bacterium]